MKVAKLITYKHNVSVASNLLCFIVFKYKTVPKIKTKPLASLTWFSESNINAKIIFAEIRTKEVRTVFETFILLYKLPRINKEELIIGNILY